VVTRHFTGRFSSLFCALFHPPPPVPTANGTFPHRSSSSDTGTYSLEGKMGRYALLWLLGVPIPILLLIYLFGGLH
jgi:hypothetical protein